MTEIFADGIRSIAMANGVLRVEFVRLKHGATTQKMEAEASGALLLPAGSLKDISAQFARTLEQLEKNAAKTDAPSGERNDLDDALTNL